MLWYTLKEQQNTLQRQAEVEGLAREAELSKLRQQLQPHFLFNSLNSINALIVSKPIQARTMIQQLSAFLRGTLKRENETWNTLDEELAHLELYLSIEQVRFGHRLKVDIENSVEQNVKLPSMVLQPLLENAIKFGLYDTVDIVKIEINAQMNEGLLIISISNPFDAETSGPANGLGFGLSGVSRRLQLLFARTDLLGISSSGDIFTTTIKIPQQ